MHALLKRIKLLTIDLLPSVDKISHIWPRKTTVSTVRMSYERSRLFNVNMNISKYLR